MAELIADYGESLLPLEKREERKRGYHLTKDQETWVKRLVRAVTLYEERHKGKALSKKSQNHLDAFIRRHHARVS